MKNYVISYDVGTTSLKTCLYEADEKIKLIESQSQSYKLTILPNGGAEQDPNDWWEAMRETTKAVIRKSGIEKEKISGISFCAQMQGVVLVDKDGNPVRKAMSYMDNRAKKQMEETLSDGLKIGGVNLQKLMKSISITGVVASSTKDPVWKYKWVKENEPEIYADTYKWLDVKDFLILKSCGEFTMTEDSAYATMLFDVKKENRCFSQEMCNMIGVDIDHLPRIIKSTQAAGQITKAAAKELGLMEGTLVFGGGGDASLIGVGAGATKPGDTHIYIGTSGWVSTVIDKPLLDISCKIAGIIGADENNYNYFAELETAGKCIEWVKEHLAYEETIDRLNERRTNGDYEEVAVDLYEYMMESIKHVPAGSSGVVFTPWLHGNRCPFEDTNARGMFFNIGMGTKKAELIHAVIEGVCYHLRWQMECSAKKVDINGSVRLVGGGALAPMTCQILSDILNVRVEVVGNPQNAGAMGAAIISTVGLGITDNLEQASSLIEVERTYYPNSENRNVYDKGFEVFKQLYYNNKKTFELMNKNEA
ncbi:MAG: FGGY-family carbohydrate kinase [Clostridia bacterium]|nr:FGGY-family carbohydrate kinase [Clostridia bacterium]